MQDSLRSQAWPALMFLTGDDDVNGDDGDDDDDDNYEDDDDDVVDDDVSPSPAMVAPL